MRLRTGFRRILGLLVCLVAGSVAAQTAVPTWQPYDTGRIDGHVVIGANPAGPLPANCPPPAEKSHYIIGMSQANRAEPWREVMDAQIAEAVQDFPQMTVIFSDARQDNLKQVADVQAFLDLGIDLLIISPNEADPLTDVIREAYQRCVPVLVLDRAVNGDQFTMFIGANNVAIGKSAGEYVASWCRTQGYKPCNIIELRGLEGSPPAKDRGDGFRAGIAGNADATIVGSQNADWLRERALDRATLLFRLNPQVNVVYAHNDPMAEAAIVAAQNDNLDLHKILFVGIDALPTAEGGIMSVLQGRIGITYVYPTGARQAIDWAAQILLHHVNPPRKIELDFSEVRSDNAQSICNIYHCPEQESAP